MARVFRFPARAAHHEVGFGGELRPAAILRLLQEAAIEASNDAGFDAAWYRNAGTQWVVRRTALEIEDGVRGGEALDISTWVADFRRVLSRRRYVLDGTDGRPVARAWSDWVYLDVGRGRPARVPAEMVGGFAAEPDAMPIDRTPLELGAAPADAFRYERPVLVRDLDGLAHANNASIVDLLEEALLAALAARGFGVERLLAEGVLVRMVALDVEYLAEARLGTTLECRLWAPASDDDRLATRIEICAGERDRPLLTQAVATWSWRQRADGRPRMLPDVLRRGIAV